MVNKYIFFTALIVYGAFALFNLGFYHPDEHYQIVEFAELKNGKNQANDLAWEYNEKIRSAIQPGFFLLLINGLAELKITDPYNVMVIVRLLTALISVAVIRAFINATSGAIIPKLRLTYHLLSYFLWFIPFVNVRFSSETYACLSFLLGIVVLMRSSQDRRYFFLGILLGFSFLFRFQTAFLSLGLVLWLCFIERISFFKISLIMIGGLVMVNIGAIIDYWFYDQYTYTFVNYFIANIVNDVASSFGTSPWYFYFSEFMHLGIFPISIIVICSFLIILFFDSKNILVWVILPFIVVHSFVPHKELRFLFPIVNFIPLLIVQAFQICLKAKLFESINIVLLKGCVGVLIVINSIALVILMLSPADDEGRTSITQYIHSNYKRDVTLWYFGPMNPYRPISPKQQFYLDRNVKQLRFDPEAGKEQLDKDELNLMVAQRDFRFSNHEVFTSLKIKPLKNGIPKWIDEVKAFFHYGVPSKSYVLYEVVM